MSIRTRYADFTLANVNLLACDTGLAMALENTADLPEMDVALVKHLAKIGNKSDSFAREAHALGKEHEGLLPRDMNLETLDRALKNRDALRERLIAAKHLVARLEAAVVLLGVDSYKDGLDIYHALKRGGTTQSLREAVKELGRNFRKKPAKAKAPDSAKAGTGKAEVQERAEGGVVAGKSPDASVGAPAAAEENVHMPDRSSGPDAGTDNTPPESGGGSQRSSSAEFGHSLRRADIDARARTGGTVFTTGQECPVQATDRNVRGTMKPRPS